MNCHLEFVALTDLLKLFPKQLQEDLTSRSGWTCSGAKELYCHWSTPFASQELGVSAHTSMEMPCDNHTNIFQISLKKDTFLKKDEILSVLYFSRLVYNVLTTIDWLLSSVSLK